MKCFLILIYFIKKETIRYHKTDIDTEIKIHGLLFFFLLSQYSQIRVEIIATIKGNKTIKICQLVYEPKIEWLINNQTRKIKTN